MNTLTNICPFKKDTTEYYHFIEQYRRFAAGTSIQSSKHTEKALRNLAEKSKDEDSKKTFFKMAEIQLQARKFFLLPLDPDLHKEIMRISIPTRQERKKQGHERTLRGFLELQRMWMREYKYEESQRLYLDTEEEVYLTELDESTNSSSSEYYMLMLHAIARLRQEI